MKSWNEKNYVFEEKEFLEKLSIEGKDILKVQLFEDRKVKVVTKK